jgi:hypothetical protein
MKRTLAICLLIVVGTAVGGLLYNTFNFGTVSYEKQIVEVEKVVEVDTLGKMIKDAQEAKSSEIKASGEQARIDAETRMMEAIELEVRQAYSKELKAREVELEKKQGTF